MPRSLGGRFLCRTPKLVPMHRNSKTWTRCGTPMFNSGVNQRVRFRLQPNLHTLQQRQLQALQLQRSNNPQHQPQRCKTWLPLCALSLSVSSHSSGKPCALKFAGAVTRRAATAQLPSSTNTLSLVTGSSSSASALHLSVEFQPKALLLLFAKRVRAVVLLQQPALLVASEVGLAAATKTKPMRTASARRATLPRRRCVRVPQTLTSKTSLTDNYNLRLLLV